jgi:RNA polymerase sigma-70 factor (ECF subfamily)
MAAPNGRALEAQETMAMIREAIDALPPAHRKLFLLVRFQGLSLAEAAAAVGLKPGSAKVELFRIAQKLGRALAPTEVIHDL